MNVTDDVGRNPVPLMVRLNGLEPAGAETGDNPVIEGTGLGAAETVKLTGCELPPPGVGLVTTTRNDPAVSRSEAVRVIVS